jgi:hypothetical protein
LLVAVVAVVRMCLAAVALAVLCTAQDKLLQQPHTQSLLELEVLALGSRL